MATIISGSDNFNTSNVATQTELDNVDTSADAIGVNQTWQDVTASRSEGVTYTNTTGKPILLSYQANSTGYNSAMRITVDGISTENRVGASASGNKSSVTIIVPNGSTYKYEIDVGAAYLLAELR